MSISVIDPINLAIERTKSILFRPFDFNKWLGLGLCAFLMNLGSGGGGGGGGANYHNGGSSDELEHAAEWVRDNLALITTIVVVVLGISIILGLVFTWLGSRGRFMFLDGVVHNRGDVTRPWHEYRREGNSLFLFRVCVGLVTLVFFLLIVALGVTIAWPDIAAGEFRAAAFASLALSLVLIILFALAVGAISIMISDLIAPMMYLDRLTAMEAWRRFKATLWADYRGQIVLFFVMKFVLGLGVGMLATFAVCLTCCMVAIPYVGTVILLPLFVFQEAYTLHYLEQFGPEWQFFPIADAKVVPPPDKSPGPFSDGYS